MILTMSIWIFIQGASADDPDHMDVVLVACKRDVVEDYQFVLREAGLEAKCVDCSVLRLKMPLS